MTNRGKYIKYAELSGNKNAKISRVRDVQDYGPVVDDYVITIDPLQYLPGTANHELGHLADQVVNNANKLQYNMYRNKSRFVDRINNLTPMEFITPLLLPVAGYEINKE